MSSFRRFRFTFPDVPASVVEHGHTPEEYRLTRGEPLPVSEPAAFPMMDSQRIVHAQHRLAVDGDGSDIMRIASPAAQDNNAQINTQQMFISRQAEAKLNTKLVQFLTQAVATVKDEKLRGRMQRTLARLERMRRTLHRFRTMTDQVYLSVSGNARG